MMKAMAEYAILSALSVLLIFGCAGTRTAKEGDTVKINYTGTLEDGSEFDSSRDREPLEFTIGSGQVIPGFNDAVIGMKVGEKKTITIPPEEAYGPHNEQMVITIPRSQFPPDMELTVGQQIQSQQPGGRIMRATVLELSPDSVKIDANHPLAGKTLTFDIELVEIKKT
jgi:peptidylprolyl isomerase